MVAAHHLHLGQRAEGARQLRAGDDSLEPAPPAGGGGGVGGQGRQIVQALAAQFREPANVRLGRGPVVPPAGHPSQPVKAHDQVQSRPDQFVVKRWQLRLKVDAACQEAHGGFERFAGLAGLPGVEKRQPQTAAQPSQRQSVFGDVAKAGRQFLEQFASGFQRFAGELRISAEEQEQTAIAQGDPELMAKIDGQRVGVAQPGEQLDGLVMGRFGAGEGALSEEHQGEVGVGPAQFAGVDDLFGMIGAERDESVNGPLARLAGLGKQGGALVRLGAVAGGQQGGAVDLDARQVQLALGAVLDGLEQIDGLAIVLVGAREFPALLVVESAVGQQPGAVAKVQGAGRRLGRQLVELLQDRFQVALGLVGIDAFQHAPTAHGDLHGLAFVIHAIPVPGRDLVHQSAIELQGCIVVSEGVVRMAQFFFDFAHHPLGTGGAEASGLVVARPFREALAQVQRILQKRLANRFGARLVQEPLLRRQQQALGGALRQQKALLGVALFVLRALLARRVAFCWSLRSSRVVLRFAWLSCRAAFVFSRL